MIIEHEGMDGSGKSAGMAMDIEYAIKREERRRNGKRIAVLGHFGHKGIIKLKHPLQMIYLKNTIIFLDELQDWYPAENRPMDEVTRHIVSTHRHEKNVIQYATQAHEYMHTYWRRNTRFVWQYEALWADRLTGESKMRVPWLGLLGRHKRRLIKGVDRELGRRKPDVSKKQKFWLTPRLVELFNSYGSHDDIIKTSPRAKEILAMITDPNNELPPEPSPYTLADGEQQDDRFNGDPGSNDLEEGIEWHDEPDDLRAGMEPTDPRKLIGSE